MKSPKKNGTRSKAHLFLTGIFLAGNLFPQGLLFAEPRTGSFETQEAPAGSHEPDARERLQQEDLRKWKQEEQARRERIEHLKKMLAMSQSKEAELAQKEAALREQAAGAQKNLQWLERQQQEMNRKIESLVGEANRLAARAPGVRSEGAAQSLTQDAYGLMQRATDLQSSYEKGNLDKKASEARARVTGLNTEISEVQAQRRNAAKRSRELEAEIARERETAALKGMQVGEKKQAPKKAAPEKPLTEAELRDLISKNPKAAEKYKELYEAQDKLKAMQNLQKDYGAAAAGVSHSAENALEEMFHGLAEGGIFTALELLHITEALKMIPGMPDLALHDFRLQSVFWTALSLVFPQAKLAAFAGKLGVELWHEYDKFKGSVESVSLQAENLLKGQKQTKNEVSAKRDEMQELRQDLAKKLGVSVEDIPANLSKSQLESHLTSPPKDSYPEISVPPTSPGSWNHDSTTVDLRQAGSNPTPQLLRKPVANPAPPKKKR